MTHQAGGPASQTDPPDPTAKRRMLGLQQICILHPLHSGLGGGERICATITSWSTCTWGRANLETTNPPRSVRIQKPALMGCLCHEESRCGFEPPHQPRFFPPRLKKFDLRTPVESPPEGCSPSGDPAGHMEGVEWEWEEACPGCNPQQQAKP